MCKGKPPGTPSAVLRAGEIVNVQFEGSARHGGGLCQFAISYDNDKTFNVIQEIQGACPDGTSLPINIASKLCLAGQDSCVAAVVRSMHVCLDVDQCDWESRVLHELCRCAHHWTDAICKWCPGKPTAGCQSARVPDRATPRPKWWPRCQSRRVLCIKPILVTYPGHFGL